MRGERRRLAHDRDEARGEQRMAAEIGEEIRVERDRPAAAARAWPRRAASLRFRCAALPALRRRAPARSARCASRLLRSTLPEDERRQLVERLEARRHHIGRQPARAARCAATCVSSTGAVRRHDEGDELVDARLRCASTTAACATPAMLGELGLDLAEFDAKAADLDLIVDAAAKQKIAVLVDDAPRRRSDRARDRSRPEAKGLAMNFSAVSSSRSR